MKYIVYLTTHLPTGAYYIGFHSCEQPEEFDGYLGSGKGIKELLRIYPRYEFKRETLKIFDNYTDAVQFESDTVVQFIDDDLCVNEDKYGGGIFHISKIDNKEDRSEYARQRIERHPHSLPNNKGRKHSGGPLLTMRDSVQKTHKNSKWITNGHKEIRLEPDKNESDIPDGWKFGRCDDYIEVSKTRKTSANTIQKIKNTTIGGNVWNNGNKSIRVLKDELPPEGYIYRGFAGERKTPANTGNKQYHHPESGKIIRLMPNDPIPFGYIQGSGRKKKTTTKYSTVDKSSSIELLPGENIPEGYYTGKELYTKRRKSYGNKNNT